MTTGHLTAASRPERKTTVPQIQNLIQRFNSSTTEEVTEEGALIKELKIEIEKLQTEKKSVQEEAITLVAEVEQLKKVNGQEGVVKFVLDYKQLNKQFKKQPKESTGAFSFSVNIEGLTERLMRKLQDAVENACFEIQLKRLEGREEDIGKLETLAQQHEERLVDSLYYPQSEPVTTRHQC
ncbi:hypothetical protein P153DRAFT_412446 [Dothidotthia symphoricarpi CBS 119687]|uniref:Uncharacterized protein n=1 Tax=Dothidotthia symphoricarpi CBS 119687 TaxID=1392245 RepID=A0A6A5ZWT4_9PLEO|nr:uncharacterized protein P153DRAFT_412446 [Dothidotthia symphoricarpi CBS 119687]KAF2123756.1 hypothetical protein P153DRAFT_412446 [Dothidotthia symphoricarpi CBS 119687]